MPAPVLAKDGDVWFHHIIARGKYTRNPLRVKGTYIERALTPNTPDAERPWRAEISGRLLSKSTDIRRFAEAVAAEKNNPAIKFQAVMHSVVAALRTNGWDVWDDPTNDDPAHALLTVAQLNPVQVLPSAPSAQPETGQIDQSLVRAIAEHLSLAEAQGVDALEAGCRKPV